MPETETRTQSVYRRIRNDILSGGIKPGSQLQFAWLKQEYGASMGVLREALARLSAEGLTVSSSQQGFRVMDVSLEDLFDLTYARCEIESIVLKDSILRGDIEWEARILSAHHLMERTPKEDPKDANLVTFEWAQAHQNFHLSLYSAAKNRRLKEIAGTLRASAEVYRQWSIPFEMPKRDVGAEHKNLLDLSLARKADEAAAALIQHMRLTEHIISDGVEDHDDIAWSG